MADTDVTDNIADGRRKRRVDNRLAVLDAVISMFAEESLLPSIEEASKRSGLSLRSVYRYFVNPDQLIQAAISRNIEQGEEIAAIASIGKGDIEGRLADFVTVRLRLYEFGVGTFRAAVHNAPRNIRLRDALEDTRRRLRRQLEIQFAIEIGRLPTSMQESTIAAADVLTQFDSIDLLRRHRRMSVAEAESVLKLALRALLV